MAVVGLDIGTSAVRGVLLDDEGRFVTRDSKPLPSGRRTDDGGHLLDEEAVLAATREAAEAVCQRARVRAGALAVSATAGTLCFRDGEGRPVGEAVAYDDTRHGSGLERVRGWVGERPGTRRVLSLADAAAEMFGGEAGFTDWTNALKLGWDPLSLSWPVEPGDGLAELLPRPAPPASRAGRVSSGDLVRRGLLVRGATDGCAMQVACGTRPGRWSISLGTTVIWKTAALGEAPPVARALPPGAYIHRMAEDLWFPGAAGNSGGGVLRALEPGTELADLDRTASLPSGFAAYPLARPGDRFPVADPGFAGFGLPARDDPRLHAALLEGVAFVVRLGIERLVAAGVEEPETVTVTGGGSASEVWMRVLAAALGRPVRAAPTLEPAVGAALLAAAAVRDVALSELTFDRTALGEVRSYEPEEQLAAAYEERYSAFLASLPPPPAPPSS